MPGYSFTIFDKDYNKICESSRIVGANFVLRIGELVVLKFKSGTIEGRVFDVGHTLKSSDDINDNGIYISPTGIFAPHVSIRKIL